MVRVADVSPTPLCPDCGTELSREPWAAGLCPHCLVELALAESSAAAEELDDPENLPTLEYATETLAPGQILGERYQIRSLLGRGGMGEVWRAYDLKLRVDVALKALRVELLADKRALDLLRREVRAAREVISPNVCRVFDLVELDGQELVSMEYIDGTTLLEIVRTRGPLELGEAREIASQFLVGLEAIHHAGLVHRDLKPENVMTTLSGRVVVMDFGIAKALADRKMGTVAGTPAYMAPEQMRGEAVDARADVFSAGVVLAEMIAPDGVRDREAREAIWRGLHRSPAELPDTPWTSVLAKAVAQQPEQRFASASVLARALEEVTLRVEGAEDVEPYPGLASFTQEDAEYFFGRELEVEAMWKKLRRPHLLALIGPSGAGKSSFLRAGLLPAMPLDWRVVICAPGRRPYAALAQGLAGELAGDVEAIRQLPDFDQPDVAVSLVADWARRHKHALVIVDQFEELFTLNPPEVQERFAELLGRLALEANVHVLLSMRDDFLFYCYPHEALRPILSELTLLGAPTGAALRRAVVQPALKCGYRFEDEELVEEILTEVEGERGALPMLAFAAARLWETRDRDQGLLTREAYERIGGVGGALAQHAEVTLEKIGSERIPIVRELFRNLVTAEGTRAARDRDELLSVFGDGMGGGVGEGLVPSRAGASPAPTSAGEGGPDNWRLTTDDRVAAEGVLDTLIDARLLTSYELPAAEGEETGHHRIEIIHESLLSAWPRLVRWQTQDTEGAQLRDELRQAAQMWEQHDRSEDLLWTGTAFREFQLWRERYPGGLSELEDGFAREMEAHAHRRRRRRRFAMAAVITLALGVAGVTSTLWQRSETARQQATAAEQQAREEALRAEASKLLALAQLRGEDDPTEALAYATASLELAATEEARVFALRLLWEGPPALELVGSDNREPVFSPDGSRLAAAGHSEEVPVWTAEGGDPPIALPGHLTSSRGYNQASWASNELLLTWHWTEGRARAWSFPGGRLVREIDLGAPSYWQVGPGILLVETKEDVPGREVYRLFSWRLPDGEARELGRIDWSALGPSEAAFLPSGRGWLYTKGGSVYLRPLPAASGREDQILGRHASEVKRLWPLRRVPVQIYSADRDGEIRIWDFSQDEPQLAKVIPRHEGEPEQRVPDPSLRWAVGSVRTGQQARVWDLAAWPAARPLTLRRSGSWYGAVSGFHPRGDWLVVSTHRFSRLTFWPLKGSWPHVVDGYSDIVRPLAFSPDGRWLATSWADRTIRLWPLPGNPSREVKTLALPEKQIWNRLVFDPRGRYLFVVGNRDRAYVVPLDGSPPRKLEGFSDDTSLLGAAVSPSGQRVATAFFFGGGPKTLRVWDLETGELRLFDLPEGYPSETKTGYEGQISSIAFADESTLYTGGDGGVRRWNLETGANELVFPVKPGYHVAMVLGPDGRTALVKEIRTSDPAARRPMELLDLATGVSRPLPVFGELAGRRIHAVASGTLAASGDPEGIVRVGSVSGGEPHLLVGHEGPVDEVAISPDGRWIASTGDDNTLRLWPMPDLDKPPLHSLPLEELLAKLESLTNIRVVRDPESAEGWKVELEPFPGWAEVPEW